MIFSSSICSKCKKEKSIHRSVDGRCPLKINVYSKIRDMIWYGDPEMVFTDSGKVKPTKEERKLGLSQEQIIDRKKRIRDMFDSTEDIF